MQPTDKLRLNRNGQVPTLIGMIKISRHGPTCVPVDRVKPAAKTAISVSRCCAAFVLVLIPQRISPPCWLWGYAMCGRQRSLRLWVA